MIAALKKSLVDTPLLETHYNGIFIYRNIVLQAKRNEQEELIFEPDNIENILNEIFLNSKRDLSIPLKNVMQIRLTLYEKFYQQWTLRNYNTCSNIIYTSDIPEKIINGFIRFINENRGCFLREQSEISDFVYLFVVLLLSYSNKIFFWLNRNIRLALGLGNVFRF